MSPSAWGRSLARSDTSRGCLASSTHRSADVERVCFQLQVRPERIGEYRARHDEVWPEMREELRRAGWGNHS